jgi:ankyrin repeat protein
MIKIKEIIIVLLAVFVFVLPLKVQEIHTFAGRGDIEKVKMLLEQDPALLDHVYVLGTPTLWAARYGRINVLDYLIKMGADMNKKTSDITPLFHAAFMGEQKTVEFLLSKGAEIGFFETVECGFKGLVIKMISEGEDIHQFKSSGYLPLHRAARYGHKEIIDYFIENGLEKNIRDNSGQNLIHSAAFGGQYELVKHLVNLGVDINAQTKRGDTPLDHAVDNGDPRIIEYLEEKGAVSGGKIECTIDEITDSIYKILFPGRPDSNAGIFLFSAGAVLIDTGGGNRTAETLGNIVKERNNAEVKYIINTHNDWDHKRGNKFYEGRSVILNGLNIDDAVKKGILAAKESRIKNNYESTLSKYYMIKLGGTDIVIFPIPGSHTPSDMFIYFRGEDVVFTGDAITSGILQRDSESEDKYVERVKRRANYFGAYHNEILRILIKMCSSKTICVPGHGGSFKISHAKEYLSIAEEANNR